MKWILITAALLGTSSIIIGAALRHIGNDLDMDVLQTALRYHQFHSLALLTLGLYALDKTPSWRLTIAPSLFAIGTIIFSGSLYVSVLYNMPILGYLTPVGGITLIAGWLSLLFQKNTSDHLRDAS